MQIEKTRMCTGYLFNIWYVLITVKFNRYLIIMIYEAIYKSCIYFLYIYIKKIL